MLKTRYWITFMFPPNMNVIESLIGLSIKEIEQATMARA